MTFENLTANFFFFNLFETEQGTRTTLKYCNPPSLMRKYIVITI